MATHTPATTGGAPTTAQFEYKSWVKKIVDLPFQDLSSRELVQMCYLSWVAAVEFAEALRVAERVHGDHAGLQDMIAGELQTSNLAFGDYRRAGDHHEFLAHFLGKDGQLAELEAELGSYAAEYLGQCRALDDETRAMSVFSREEELPGIFTRFLQAPKENWQAPRSGRLPLLPGAAHLPGLRRGRPRRSDRGPGRRRPRGALLPLPVQALPLPAELRGQRCLRSGGVTGPAALVTAGHD